MDCPTELGQQQEASVGPVFPPFSASDAPGWAVSPPPTPQGQQEGQGLCLVPRGRLPPGSGVLGQLVTLSLLCVGPSNHHSEP